MTREGFEALVRDALTKRDKMRKSRLFDPHVTGCADDQFVAAVLEAAGYATPPEVTVKAEKASARRSRAQAKKQDAAFGGKG
jgi:hypothetical protein